MIKKFNEFVNGTNDNIIIENDNIIIEILKDSYNISESHNFRRYDRKIINNLYLDKFKQIEKEVEDYINNINPIGGKYIDKNTENYRYVNFNIVPTEHWYLKFFRKDFEDLTGRKNYVNPKVNDMEGVKLVKNNIDFITKNIMNGTIKYGVHFLIKSKDTTTPIYTQQVVILKNKNRLIRDIKLISQFKGRDYYDDDVRKFKLHTNGPIKKPTV